MKILIVAATWMEVKLLIDEFDFVAEKTHFLYEYQLAGNRIDVLIAGIGTTFATFHLTTTLQKTSYHLVLNVGVAASFTNDLKIGEVVNVISEEFADLGVEEKRQFLTLFESGFMEGNEFPFENGILKATPSNGLMNLNKVRGITANKSHGENSSIAALKAKFSAHVESTEGAAVLYVCIWYGIPCYEIRAISNYVAPREVAQWNIPLALENLKTSVLEVLTKVTIAVH
ncbi:futalosine hydrolase [Maribellus comscasis]|uniref:Futalosine hydrolase n=1 Tax=Maribellus comscasis TaxID=2681766 RepID=A0A6I6JZ84_9BACT|nr:futalosine hydrolase [Maribellus comscasis]QGY43014.1 futalosine hydrolase [Maribellus comscasis]